MENWKLMRLIAPGAHSRYNASRATLKKTNPRPPALPYNQQRNSSKIRKKRSLGHEWSKRMDTTVGLCSRCPLTGSASFSYSLFFLNIQVSGRSCAMLRFWFISYFSYEFSFFSGPECEKKFRKVGAPHSFLAFKPSKKNVISNY